MKKILPVLLIVLLLSGCKTKHTFSERIITKLDSTAIVLLKAELKYKAEEVFKLKKSLDKSKEENIKLSSEIEIHSVNYDTNATVDIGTGKYPIASETTTTSKSILEKSIKEKELLLQESERTIQTLEIKNSNLTSVIETLTETNKDLKSKTVKDSFSFKWYLYGIISGVIIIGILLVIIRIR